MTNPHIDQAREWAEWADKKRGMMDGGAIAAVEVIKSLPDQWIDAKELRGIYDRYRASEITLHEAFSAAVALATPPLQNLAELVEQGNDPHSYQWMQAQVFPTDSTLGIITGVDGYSRSAIILFTDGMAKNVPWAFITPLTDHPKLEWPGDGVVDAEIVEDDEPVMLPRPEDVPEGEPWTVQYEGMEIIGCRNEPESTLPWLVIRRDGHQYDYCRDTEITLISRLVPEVKP